MQTLKPKYYATVNKKNSNAADLPDKSQHYGYPNKYL